MTKRVIAAIVLALGLCGPAASQSAAARAEDEAAIRAIITGLAEAWTRGDAKAWSEPFVEYADFTVWNGRQIQGRDAITSGHEQIFSTVYKETKQRLDVRRIRFLRGDVAVVHVEGSVVKKAEEFPATPQVVPVFVMTKENGRWRIVAFQNTKKTACPGVRRARGAHC